MRQIRTIAIDTIATITSTLDSVALIEVELVDVVVNGERVAERVPAVEKGVEKVGSDEWGAD